MKLTSTVAAVFAMLTLALGLPLGAAAQSAPQVTLDITGGQLTYALSSGMMTPISFDYSEPENAITTGTVTLTVDDRRGTFEGWSIDIESTAFDYAGEAPGNNDIPAANATVIPQSPSLVAGQGLDGVQMGTAGTLGTKRTVISAVPGFGSGAFSQELEVQLHIPALSPTGTYTALLTVSTSAAPGSQGDHTS